MTTNNRVKTKRLTTRQPFFAYLARNKKTRAASGAYFLYKTNRKESKLKFQKQAVLFKVRNIHFFHVVAVVFDCGYYFVDVGVVVADYFGQTRYARRSYFFTSATFLTASFSCDSHIPSTCKDIFFILSPFFFYLIVN